MRADKPRLIGGDTEDMSREHAESHLRLVAEAELRRVTASPADSAVGQWHSPRLALVAQALCAVGVIDVGTAVQIQAELDLALAERQFRPLNAAGTGPGGPLSLAARDRLERLLQIQAARTATEAAPVSGLSAGQAASQQTPWRVVPVGQVIRIGDEEARGELCLLSYVQTADGARFTMAGRMQGLPSMREHMLQPGVPPQRRLLLHPRLFFDRFTVEDDRGARYRLGFSGGSGAGRPYWQGVLDLRPEPPRDIRWLDLYTATGETAARINLDTQIPSPDVTVTERAASPGELLLDVIAARLLTGAAALPQDTPEQLAASGAGLLPHAAGGLGDIIAALQATGVLSPSSPVPGQLAGLCASLGVSGHGITAPPAGDLPQPWLSMLSRYHRRQPRPAPAPGSWAAAAVELPRLDGARMAVLGLHQGEDGTILHVQVQASGVTPEDDWEYYRGIRPLPVLWIRDSADRWHATRTTGWSPLGNDEVMLRLAIVPPLEADIPWIDMVAAGRSAEVRATLPLRWS
jgi:hypothetical protein